MKKSNPIIARSLAASPFFILMIGFLVYGIYLLGPNAPAAAAQQFPTEIDPTPTATPPPVDNFVIPNGVEVVTPYLNLRTGPSMTARIIGVVKAGDLLTITKVSPNLNWIAVVTADKRAGWVSSAPQYVNLNTIVDEPLAPPQVGAAGGVGPEIGDSQGILPPLAPAPVLLESATSGPPGEFGLTQFEWRYDGPLPRDQGFEVRVWREGQEQLGVHDAVLDNNSGQIKNLGNNTYQFTADISNAPGVKGDGPYLWTVAVVETGQGYAGYETTGISAQPAPLGQEISASTTTAMLASTTPCGPAATVAPNGQYEIVKIFYGTDRNITGNADPGRYFGIKQGPLRFGTADISIPWSHQKGEIERPDLWMFEWNEDPTKHVTLLSVNVQASENAFIDALQARIAASLTKQAFVFIHGYNVTFEAAAQRTAQMACDLKFDGAPILYSWPSDGSIRGYWADETDVKKTVSNLESFLESVSRQSGAQSIFIIGHSMGNRALAAALVDMLNDDDATNRPAFQEIIMAAADIGQSEFINTLASPLATNYKRVTLYASTDDKALRLSQLIHRQARVGDFRDGPLIFDKIDSIDATGVDPNWLGHGYYAAPSVIDDIVSLLRDGNGASNRSHLSGIDFPPGRYWVFVP